MQRVLPAGPAPTEQHPDEPVSRRQARPGPLSLEHGNLLAEGNVLDEEIGAAAEESGKTAREDEQKLGHQLKVTECGHLGKADPAPWPALGSACRCSRAVASSSPFWHRTRLSRRPLRETLSPLRLAQTGRDSSQSRSPHLWVRGSACGGSETRGKTPPPRWRVCSISRPRCSPIRLWR